MPWLNEKCLVAIRTKHEAEESNRYHEAAANCKRILLDEQNRFQFPYKSEDVILLLQALMKTRKQHDNHPRSNEKDTNDTVNVVTYVNDCKTHPHTWLAKPLPTRPFEITLQHVQ